MTNIDILFPYHNGMPFLKDSLDSILVQSQTDFHCILVDDASSDESQAYVRAQSDPRLLLLSNPRRLGLAASLNLGIAAAHSVRSCQR